MTSTNDFLKKFTHARIALGRVGNSLPTQTLLQLRLAHALARDSVWMELDPEKLPVKCELIQSQCSDKKEFLLNPEKGRTLNSESKKKVKTLSAKNQSPDCLVVLADGLSATALHQNGASFVTGFFEEVGKTKLKLGPLLLARYGRVALADEVGELLGARSVLMLIGERPGLSSAESLSVYFTYEPARTKTDAERNCISNIHRNGLSPEAAGKMAAYLLQQSLTQRLSGVGLKLEYPREYQRILPL